MFLAKAKEYFELFSQLLLGHPKSSIESQIADIKQDIETRKLEIEEDRILEE